jgi:hypothetical protein
MSLVPGGSKVLDIGSGNDWVANELGDNKPVFPALWSLHGPPAESKFLAAN